MHKLNQFLQSCYQHLAPHLQKNWEIDHICYRTSSQEQYEEVKKMMTREGQLLIESPIAGRPISTFQLNDMYQIGDFHLNVLEVPAPKEGRPYREGFEHLEIVTDLSFTQLKKRFPDFKWSERALSKSLNPELEAHFEHFNVKFHHHALAHIINIEKHELAHAFLKESKMLEIFSQYSPLISGSIPLGIDTPNSDLDILFYASDFDQCIGQLKQHFPQIEIQHRPEHLSARLSYHGFPIEFFVQNCPTLEQNGHRHLRVEGRLLKLLGTSFANQIKNLKLQGHKTEPAFGLALQLSKPYETLLELYNQSERKLLQRFS